MRALDRGESFVVTRNGVAVAELMPLRQRRFVPAEAYGRVYAAGAEADRKARGRRALDLLIAATALAAGLPLYTRNPDGFGELGNLVEVVPVRPRL
jgi:predicted nucleic acid-binding protein